MSSTFRTVLVVLAPAAAAAFTLAIHRFVPNEQEEPLNWLSDLPVWKHPYPIVLVAILAASLVAAAAYAAVRPAKTYDAPADWTVVTFAAPEKRLADQKAASPRVAFPNPDRTDTLPPGLSEQARLINWTKIIGGYQPEMTAAWFNMYGEFRQEAKLDRVFGSTLFWVVIRANDCFY